VARATVWAVRCSSVDPCHSSAALDLPIRDDWPPASTTPAEIATPHGKHHATITAELRVGWVPGVKRRRGTPGAYQFLDPRGVYSFFSFITEGNCASLGGYPLWLAIFQSATPPAPAPWSAWKVWQSGAASSHDNDVFNGTPAELTAWIGSFQPKVEVEVQNPKSTGVISVKRLDAGEVVVGYEVS